jgi:hypothetical protein
MAQKRMLKVQELLRMGGSSVYSWASQIRPSITIPWRLVPEKPILDHICGIGF